MQMAQGVVQESCDALRAEVRHGVKKCTGAGTRVPLHPPALPLDSVGV